MVSVMYLDLSAVLRGANPTPP